MPFVRKYTHMWVLKTIDHDIIQLFNGNNTMQYSWRQLHNRNNLSEECFAATGIGEPCKPVSLLYTPGFCDPRQAIGPPNLVFLTGFYITQ